MSNEKFTEFLVQVRDYNFEQVVKSIPCTSLRKAKMVEAGINRNLNHDEYFTDIAEITEPRGEA